MKGSAEGRLHKDLIRTARQFSSFLPILAGVILLIGLGNTLMPKSFYLAVFRKNTFLDSIIGGALGSVLAGHPITSYILGGEFLKQGVGLVAVTSFIVAWVTVGLVQLPAEAMFFGKRFAVLRNLLSFVFSIMVAITTVLILGLL